MELLEANNVTVKVVNSESEGERPRSEIFLNDKPTGKFVSGAFLEAAFQWRDWYLLLLTNDFIFEETLDVHLLNEHFEIVDSATLGWFYVSGVFKAPAIVQPNIVQFRFLGDMDWYIELLPEYTFRLPILTEPPGVWRKPGFLRHFRIYRKPRG